MNQSRTATLAPATPLDCLSCRELSRDLSPLAASTIDTFLRTRKDLP